jgi:hypothetical protein
MHRTRQDLIRADAAMMDDLPLVGPDNQIVLHGGVAKVIHRL